jgi:hypothetical protein
MMALKVAMKSSLAIAMKWIEFPMFWRLSTYIIRYSSHHFMFTSLMAQEDFVVFTMKALDAM